MKVLCVLSNMFPYGHIEPYMETESNYYDRYEKVYICSLMIKRSERKRLRPVHKDIEVVPVLFSGKIRYLLWSISCIFDRNFYIGIVELIHRNKLNVKNLASVMIFLSRAHYEAHVILKKIGNEIKDKKVMFYSYRFEYQPYVAILLKEKLRMNQAEIVARAHGYDLYEKFNPREYIPLRKVVFDNIKYVFPCSEHGSEYLIDNHKEFEDKIKTKYLGTVDHGLGPVPSGSALTFLSCSNVVEIKRLDRIFEVLNCIEKYSIRWIHYGDGSRMDEVCALVKNSTASLNIEFRGRISNSDLMDLYKKEPFDAFINLSDSEGLPVSIMEAMSFGIPCIATDVGGTGEIVIDDENGILVSPFMENECIAKVIEQRADSLLKYRSGARLTWERKFNALENYRKFINEIYDIGVE